MRCRRAAYSLPPLCSLDAVDRNARKTGAPSAGQHVCSFGDALKLCGAGLEPGKNRANLPTHSADDPNNIRLSARIREQWHPTRLS